MALVDKDIQLELLSRSGNCSEGNQWVWNHVAQCLEETDHVIGFIFGGFAVILSATSYISLSVDHVQRSNQTNKNTVHLSSAMNLLSEISSLFGAILSAQLPFQVLYSITMVPVHTICYACVCLSGPRKTKEKVTREKMSKCLYPFHILMPAVFIITLALESTQLFSKQYENIRSRSIKSFQTVLPKLWLTGYILGALAGFVFCCVRITEMFHLNRGMDSKRCLPTIYLTSILGGSCYVYSVLSQSLSMMFIYHTLPWTLSRLIAVGMDTGIIVQRMLYNRRGRKRKLSTQDAKCLLSSDDDSEVDVDFSDDGSEEVIWMPLQMVDSVKSYNQVPVSRIQIVSESDINVMETESVDINRDTVENGDDKNSITNNSLSSAQSLDKLDKENSNSRPSNVCKNNNFLNFKSEIEDIAKPPGERTRHNYMDSEHSSTSSSCESEEEANLDNNIITANIRSLTEVSKEEKIASWINNSN